MAYVPDMINQLIRSCMWCRPWSPALGTVCYDGQSSILYIYSIGFLFFFWRQKFIFNSIAKAENLKDKE